MRTPEGRAKSVHNSGVSRVVKQLVFTPAKRIGYVIRLGLTINHLWGGGHGEKRIGPSPEKKIIQEGVLKEK